MASCPSTTSMSDKNVLACDKLYGAFSSLKHNYLIHKNTYIKYSYINSVKVMKSKLRLPLTTVQPENLETSAGSSGLVPSRPLQTE